MRNITEECHLYDQLAYYLFIYLFIFIYYLFNNAHSLDSKTIFIRYAPIKRRLPGRPKRRWLEKVTGH
jgi:hypothetical protein